ncbi:MAG: efflux RND transporter periplasmic adaptor subunit [Acidobacteriota bacterium]
MTTRDSILLLVLAVAISACGGGDQGQMPSSHAPTVRVATVVEDAVRDSFRFVGRVQAVDSVDLIARVPGFLERRAFEEGSDVEKGQLLFEIERAPYLAAVSAARADVTDAEATLANAEQYLERLRSVQEGGVAGADLDAADAARREARARLDAATARLEAAEIDLGYTQIRAPIAGRIGRATITEGNLVGPDSGVLTTIIRLDPIYVTFNVSARDITDARQESVAAGRVDLPIFVPRLELANGTEYPRPGTIGFLDNRVEQATGTVLVRATFENPEGLLLPGQFVTVTAERQDPHPALLVPQKAVVQNQEGHSVFVVGDDDTASLRLVTIGERQGDRYVITSGLEAGETIIVEGVQKARPGAAVDPQPLETSSGGDSDGAGEPAS